MTVSVNIVPLFTVSYTPSGVFQTATTKTFLNVSDANAFVAVTSGATMQPALGVTLVQPGITALTQVYLLGTTLTSLAGGTSFAPYTGP